LGFAAVALGFAAVALGFAAVALGFAVAGFGFGFVGAGLAPAGAGRLSLRRCGRDRGRDPITPGSGSLLMATNHVARSARSQCAKKIVLSLKRRGRSEV
jgi:hypothetical protein